MPDILVRSRADKGEILKDITLRGGFHRYVKTLFLDTYTDPDGTQAADHDPDIGAYSSTPTDAEIQGNEMVTTANNQVWRCELGHYDVIGTVEIDPAHTPTLPDQGCGMRLRFDDQTNDEFYCRVRTDIQEIELVRFGTGINEVVDESAIPHNPGDAYTLKCELRGVNIKLYLDGVLYVDYDDVNGLFGTSFGLTMRRSGTTFDNFEIKTNP